MSYKLIDYQFYGWSWIPWWNTYYYEGGKEVFFGWGPIQFRIQKWN